MDLSSLDTSKDDGAVLQLRHPGTDVPLSDVTIELASRDSDRYQKARRKQSNRRLAQSSRRGGAVKLTDEELEHDGIELLVACTLSWKGVELDGKALDCTPENARALYSRLPWVREQVDQFIGDRANFLKA